MLSKKIVIIGYSGHGIVVADAAIEQGLNLCFYSEKRVAAQDPFGLEYLGFEQDQNFPHWEKDFDCILGIGNNDIRSRTARSVLEHGKRIINVIHPRACISSKAMMGIGNFLNTGTAVNALSSMGDFCIINTGAVIEHECQLGNAVHIAPGAVLAGGVMVGDHTFIGANSVIKEGVRIGENVIIGAGSVILNNVPDNQKIVGNPGRII